MRWRHKARRVIGLRCGGGRYNGAQRDVESDAWKAALARAEGAKVYDDPKQLRRTIRAETKAKEKRQDAWKERTERQKQGMAAKQQKYVRNYTILEHTVSAAEWSLHHC